MPVFRPCTYGFLKFIFRCSVTNEKIRRVSKDKFKEALNIRPDYEYEYKSEILKVLEKRDMYNRDLYDKNK